MTGSPAPHTSPFRPDCLHGKIALVTGGGSGICFEIAKQLILHGCAGVTICGRREPFLQKAADHLNSLHPVDKSRPQRCTYKTCDVRDPSQCTAAVEFCVERYGGRLDVLVNGAAGNFLSEAASLTPKGFKTVMEIDAQGTFNMANAAHPYLKQTAHRTRGTGVVMNITATLQYGATWFQSHASAAKSAVDSLTRSLALEWGSDKIRVVGIAPGPIADTPGTTKLAPGMDEDDVNDMVVDGIPLGRMGETFDIAMAAVFLCCDGGASYVTGDILVVDGGEWLYKPPMIPREMVAELSRKVEAKSRAQAPKLKSNL